MEGIFTVKRVNIVNLLHMVIKLTLLTCYKWE